MAAKKLNVGDTVTVKDRLWILSSMTGKVLTQGEQRDPLIFSTRAEAMAFSATLVGAHRLIRLRDIVGDVVR